MEHNEKQKDTEKLSGIAVELNVLVGYQEGSVISRTIIDKNALSPCFLLTKGNV